MVFVVFGVEIGTKNRSTIERQNELPLDTDFWWMLVGFGRQVGLENRAKSEKKSIGKRIEKMMKKRCVLEAPKGGEAMGAAV